jgi:aryl-alcohol dehydrogenase-like predicted oxidoreductase
MGKDYSHKLGIGTVQFGLDYGVSNQQGKTPQKEAFKILEYAAEHNIQTLDTAHLYGDSETVIGENLPHGKGFEIVTKTIPIRKDCITSADIEMVRSGIEESIRRLKQPSLYGLMLHHADDLKAENAGFLYALLQEYKNRNSTTKIGASIYDSEQADFILDRFDIDLVQVPMNVFDQRLIESKMLAKLKQKNIEIHVRSAFLQGLIFMNPEELPSKLSAMRSKLESLQETCKKRGVTCAEFALAFLMQQEDVDKVICGVNSLDQLKQLVESVADLPLIEQELFPSFAIHDTSLINPANW